MTFSTSSDPRIPARITYYSPKVSPDEIAADYFSFASLIFGLVALMFRSKIAAWIAFFTCLSSLANQKRSERDWKQISTSVGFALIGLIVNYVTAKPEDYPL